MTARRAAFAIAIVPVAILFGVVGSVGADIEGGTFTSTEHNVRATVPRGWRVTDQPTYPGVILRMYRTRPRATILVSIDSIPTIDAACLTTSPGDEAIDASLAVQVACHQATDLEARGFTVKESDRRAAAFNFADAKRQLRLGVVILGDQVATVVLAADTEAGRAQYKSTLDKILRSLRQLDAEETASMGGAPTDAGVAPHD